MNNITIKDYQIHQQDDGSSCGAFTLYNLVCFSACRPLQIPDSNVLRQEHYNILNGGQITFGHTSDDNYLNKHKKFDYTEKDYLLFLPIIHEKNKRNFCIHNFY